MLEQDSKDYRTVCVGARLFVVDRNISNISSLTKKYNADIHAPRRKKLTYSK